MCAVFSRTKVPARPPGPTYFSDGTLARALASVVVARARMTSRVKRGVPDGTVPVMPVDATFWIKLTW